MKRNDKNTIIRNNSAKSFYLCAFFMLCFIFFIIFITSFLFFFKIKVSPSVPIVSLVFCILVTVYNLKKFDLLIFKKWPFIVISLVLPIILIGISIYCTGKIYDFSWDGNAYHKVAIGEMKNGWNPVYELVEDFDKESDTTLKLAYSQKWVNHYAKASYIYGANIYSLTGNIETAKSINLISICIMLFFVLSFLLAQGKSILFSIVFTICVMSYPVVSAQYLTNYVDLLLYIYLFLVLFSFFVFEKMSKPSYYQKVALFSYFMLLIIAINIKFTCFAYCGIFCLGYYIWYLVRLKNKKLNINFFKKVTAVSIVAVVLGAVVVGYSTYVRNILTHGNPFYPLLGKNKVDIITPNAPYYFKDKSPIEKFIISTYSETSNISRSTMLEAKYKFPFTISNDELNSLSSADVRIGGNGVYFGGIFIISLVLFIINSFKVYKKNNNLFWLIMIPVAITVIMIPLLSESWWARYFPQPYFVVLASLIFCNEVDSETAKSFLYIILGFLLLNNFLTFSISTNYSIENTKSTNLEYFNIKNQACKCEIYGYTFPGALYNSIDKLGYDNFIIDNKTKNYQIYPNLDNCTCAGEQNEKVSTTH